MAIAPGHEIGAQFLLSRLRNQFDNGASAYDAHSDQDLNTVAAFISNQVLQGWRSTVQLARSDDKQDSFTSSLPAGASQIDTRQDELTWQNTLALGRDTLQLLYAHRQEEVTSSSTRALSRTRITNSYATAYSARRGRHLVDVSARHDRSVYGDKNTAAIGYGYDFGSGLRATGSVGTSFRAPTFNELYYPGFGLESNKPEQGRNRELGLRFDGSRVQVDASWYRNRLTDMIVSASPCPGGRPGSCAYNVNEALLEGVSIGASTRLAALKVHGSIDWQDPRDETTGKRLTRRSKEHASFAADYTVGRVKTGAEWQLSGRRFDDAANLRPLGGYGLVNLYTTWQFTPELSLLVRVNNLADKQYELARNYGTAGRNWFAALRYGSR
jgi:vitamin B12 transporter